MKRFIAEENIKTSIIDLTPALAARLLKNNDGNRAKTQSLTEGYVKNMRAGAWMLNGEPIIISDEGRLLDGQHRCEAVIKSGVTIRVIVVEGIPKEAFHTLNTGKKRSYSDILSIRGEKNTKPLHSGARLILNLEMTYKLNSASLYKGKWETFELDDCIKRHPSIRDWALPPTWLKRNYQSAAYCGLGCVFSEYDHQAALDFFDSFESGANLDADNPILRLRDELSRFREQALHAPIERVASISISAFNAFVKGKRYKNRSLFTVEAFPKIGN